MLSGLILDLCPANERRRYKVTPSLSGWAQSYNQPCVMDLVHYLIKCYIIRSGITSKLQKHYLTFTYHFEILTVSQEQCC